MPLRLPFWARLQETEVLKMDEQRWDEAKAVNKFDGLQDSTDIARWYAAVEDYVLWDSWVPVKDYPRYYGRCEQEKPT